jgi:16S rRNA (cytosine1402-N4)-methyltransferase
MQSLHEAVMPREVLELLGPALPGGRAVDATVGLGGHARLLCEALGPGGSLLGLDRDPEALEHAARRLEGAPCAVRLERSRLDQLGAVLERLGYTPVDAVLLDLGVSSLQLDTPGRGFSFQAEGPLDMRMGPDVSRTAGDLIESASEERLARIFRDLGEERYARKIAAAVVRARKHAPLRTTTELAALVRHTLGKREADSRIHPATRVFQALRMAVNEELDQLEPALEAAFEHTRPGGRIAVIAFHSLEDRVVKDYFRLLASECVCPPRQPVCTCGKVREARVLTKKPLRPLEAEVERNPRCRSARLRAVEKLPEVADAA